MITATFISAGILAKILFLTFKTFTRKDALNITGAFVTALIFSIHFESWMTIPVILGLILVFIYRYRLLTQVTEQLVLLYSLTALYVFWLTESIPETSISIQYVFLFFLVGMTIYLLILNVLKVKLGPYTKLTTVVGFLVMSTYILYKISSSAIAQEEGIFAQFLIGFYGVQLASNLSLLLSFLPVGLTGKNDPNPNKTLLKKVKRHARSVQERYVTEEGSPTQVLILLLVTGIIVYLTYLGIGSWLGLTVLLLLMGNLLIGSFQKFKRE